ncbi:MAG: ribonuclease HII [Woeseiaceae bacterium]
MSTVLSDCQQADYLVAGVDEAGRGPLAGPVVAAAVILHADRPIAGLMDSKVLSELRREALSIEIKHSSLAWSLAWADAAEIDAINILQATFLAMRRALIGLNVRPGFVKVDGNRLPNLTFADRSIAGDAIVRGDASVPAISAASILAKVQRDQMMCAMDHLYPDYGFRQHKGYGTAAHRDCIARIGPCPQHRRTFRPVSCLP